MIKTDTLIRRMRKSAFKIRLLPARNANEIGITLKLFKTSKAWGRAEKELLKKITG